jgi:hypothetical protein
MGGVPSSPASSNTAFQLPYPHGGEDELTSTIQCLCARVRRSAPREAR